MQWYRLNVVSSALTICYQIYLKKEKTKDAKQTFSEMKQAVFICFNAKKKKHQDSFELVKYDFEALDFEAYDYQLKYTVCCVHETRPSTFTSRL